MTGKTQCNEAAEPMSAWLFGCVGWARMACLALLVALAACHHDSDQTKVRAAIADAASAARDNDAGALAQVLSDDFDARQGVLDRRRLLALLRLNAFHGEHVEWACCTYRR